MWCADPFVTYLKDAGYNVIRLPKADVWPLQVLTQTGSDLGRLGELSTLFVTGQNIALPPIAADVQAANISGKRTSDMSIGIGLSISDSKSTRR